MKFFIIELHITSSQVIWPAIYDHACNPKQKGNYMYNIKVSKYTAINLIQLNHVSHFALTNFEVTQCSKTITTFLRQEIEACSQFYDHLLDSLN